MAQTIESLRREAEKKFLGWGPVVGIGVAENEKQSELVFLLSKESSETKDLILDWARLNHVGVQFILTGRIRALDRL